MVSIVITNHFFIDKELYNSYNNISKLSSKYRRYIMSILDVTEDQIFHTLGRGKDPNFKPIEKERPVIARPKKTYTLNQAAKVQQAVKPDTILAQVEPTRPVLLPAVDESMIKLTEELAELNSSVSGIQKMIKWYLLPQFVVVVVLLLALIIRS